jgi:hypothetical protein
MDTPTSMQVRPAPLHPEEKFMLLNEPLASGRLSPGVQHWAFVASPNTYAGGLTVTFCITPECFVIAA